MQTTLHLQQPSQSDQDETPREPATPDELLGDDDESLEHPDDAVEVDDAD